MGCTITIDPIQTAECEQSSHTCTDELLCDTQGASDRACGRGDAASIDASDGTIMDSTRDVAPAASDMGPEDMPTCDDEIVNQGESDQDCGGPCLPCEIGAACLEGRDCTSGVCVNNECTAAACDDGFQNGSESDVDCGGNCSACVDESRCQGNQDCLSGVCSFNACASPTCTDRVLNGNETGVDCGGDCPTCMTCNEQMPCAEGNYCTGNQCSPKLGDGQQCSQNIECVSAYCANGYCCTSGTCCTIATLIAPELLTARQSAPTLQNVTVFG